MDRAVSGQLVEGSILGDYEILAVAGSGGMGIVYKAMQHPLERMVALKVIRGDIAGSAEYRERFLREARLAASVDHPNVVTVYDVGEQDGSLYLAMQWVEGEDLKHVLETSGRLAPERAIAITAQLAGALDAVHGVSGLVHRDVKPANVLLRAVEGRDHAYLTDFGVAKPSEAGDQLTRTGWVVGTTGYLSPEQIRGAEPGPRSDLYALGCLFFEALTGQAPFHGENEMAVRWAHASEPRPLPSALLPALGSRYDGFVARALAIDPEQRFGSGRELAEALTQAHKGEETAVTLSAPPPLAPSHPRTAVGPPTPLPPAHTPPPGAPAMYPAYGYVTPPPAPTPPSRSGSPLALVLLACVAIAGIAVGALAASGVLSSSGASKKLAATTTVATSTRTQAKHTASSAAGGITSCGGDLSVGPDTSCPFAHNVEEAYDHSSGGETDVSAYSPVTHLTYTMHCSEGPPHVCSGGKGASVYFTSGPTSAAPQGQPSSPPAAASSEGSGLRACDQNISVNEVTTCPFAENLFVSYWREYKANGEQSDVVTSAYSPVKHATYPMACTTEGVTVNCAGGNHAFVTFPMRAVEVYEGP